MTREEGILLSAYTGYILAPDWNEIQKFCEDTLGYPIWTRELRDPKVQEQLRMKLRPQIVKLVDNIAESEKHEQASGCPYCHEEWGTCDPKTNRFTMPPGEIQFCPMCGKPLTEEAVDLIMRRLEALQDAHD